MTSPKPSPYRRPRRFSDYALPLCIFAMAGITAYLAANLSVELIEDASETAVEERLALSEMDWAEVDANGLQVFLIGTAPNEAARFQALSQASTVVDAARVIDQMDVEDRQPIQAPRFSLEILRNGAGISLIGLVPSTTDREALVSELTELAGNTEVDDLLETARFAPPPGWHEALSYAMDALADLPGSKISVAADGVSVTARADSPEEKARIETTLSRRRPEGVPVRLDISAPRPVITPFTLRFVQEGDVARFDACAADSDATRDKILRAARAAGLSGQATCTIGLGVPTTQWGDAAALAIGAVQDLGGGTVTLSDADVALIALEGTPQDQFDQVVGRLENALPAVFALQADLPKAPDTEDEGPPEFTATLSPEGTVLLLGRVTSPVARVTATSFAKAAFGSTVVQMSARVDEDLPADWSVRVLAGIEALSNLSSGAVVVLPDTVTVRGRTGDENARSKIARLLVDKLGEQARFSTDIVYEEALDPAVSIPTPQECKGRIVAVVGDRKIRFEPGSADLDSDGRSIMDDIAEALRECPPLALEIQGYTDSQGREVMNQQLSQSRAQTVLFELQNRRVRTDEFRAIGFGEADPIADNGTEEGREANRRIEFALIVPEEALAQPAASVEEEAQSD